MAEGRFTRRSFLVASVGTYLSIGTRLESQNPSNSLCMRMIAHDHDLFEPLIAANYPGVLDAKLYHKMKPFMAIIKHEGASKAKSYAVQWSIREKGSGQPRRLLAHFLMKHSTPPRFAKTIEPGAVRLISPFFNCSPDEFSRWKQHVHSTVPGGFPYMEAEISSVDLDVAIYANGTTEGPDRNRFLNRYLAARNAEHDEGVSVARRLRAGAGSNELEDLFLKHLQKGLAAQGVSPQALYDRARGQEAAILHNLLANRGLETLKQNVARRVRYPRDPFSFSMVDAA